MDEPTQTSPEADRLPLPDMDRAREAAAELRMKADLDNQPIWRALLRRPAVAEPIFRLTTAQLFPGSMDTRRRELAIMRVGWLTDCTFEWTQHWHLSRRLGLSAEELLNVRTGPTCESFDDRDRAVLSAADDVVAGGCVSAATWLRLRGLFDDDECFDTVITVTTWFFISCIIRSLAISLPQTMAPWPPDGCGPEARGSAG